MKRNTLRSRLLTESSTSDGATLYAVLMPVSSNATIDDIFVEILNEPHLFNIIRGAADQRDLMNIKLFVNKSAAMQLAEYRLSSATSGNEEGTL